MSEVILAWLALLIILAIILGYYLGRKAYKTKFEEWKKKSRAVLGGKFSEQLAPYLPDFKYDPTEARFIGSPVDFVVFKGTSVNEPEEIVFVEVKKGKSGLSENERKLKEIIENKKVRWEMYRPW